MKEKFIRSNTRITPAQCVYIKTLAKEKKMYEGEVYRMIIDYYISNNPIQKNENQI